MAARRSASMFEVGDVFLFNGLRGQLNMPDTELGEMGIIELDRVDDKHITVEYISVAGELKVSVTLPNDSHRKLPRPTVFKVSYKDALQLWEHGIWQPLEEVNR